MNIETSFNEKKQKLATFLEFDDLIKGQRYFPGYIGELHKTFNGDIEYSTVGIESERTTRIYKTEFSYDASNQELLSFSCNCPQFELYDSCKHVAAVLFYYYDEIFTIKKDDKYKEKITASLLNLFNKEETRNQVREEVKLEIELSGNNIYSNDEELNIILKLGTNKLYQCKDSKLKKFLEAYRDQEEYNFGKSFTYNPNTNYFNKENEEILDFLLSLMESSSNRYYYGYGSSSLLSGNYNIKRFLTLINNRTFILNNYRINSIIKEFPFKSNLDLVDDKYRLNLNINRDIKYITSDRTYVQIENNLYYLDKNNRDLLNEIMRYDIRELVFNNNEKENFKKSILPIIKDNITISEKINDIKITNTIKPQLYFDLYKDFVICNLKFLYDDTLIDYFDKNSSVIRNKEIEFSVVNDLNKYNFLLDDEKIYLEDIDNVGKFIDDDLSELANKYEVFTSEKLKNISIIKQSNVSSTFSIGQDNILSYSFELGNIKDSEIVNILESIRNKKRYYRLKSGDLIDLNDKNLQELENLTTDLNLSKNDIKNGGGVIPKYRAIYLDSLKSDKYHIIKTNNLFDELINRFQEYKDSNINLSKKDKELLRGYQVDGVKWLYNIDKTGFGGILADEMGLGKSIQTIYYIKELLKEDSSYKFLIVAPTSLAYNWESEFNKFGQELKYKVFVGIKKVRMKMFSEIDNYNIIITTYGLLREDYDYYKDMKFKTMIIDEAQTIKNVHAGISTTVKSIKADTKLALTGTPIENSLLELWSIFDYIMPGFLASLETFDHKYKIKEFDEDADLKLTSLNKLVSPFIMRRRKKEVIKDLPDKIENNIYVELTKEQKKIYLAELERVKQEMSVLMSSQGISKARFMILQLLTKLRQICIEPQIIYPEYNGGSGKIDEFVKVVKETIANGHKILIFTSFKSALLLTKDILERDGITSYTIDGSVSSKKRMDMVEKFNNDDTNVFFIMLKAGGTGLNLVGADVVIHLDLWWNPQVENQATDRAHRIGQKKTVQVIRFISKGTIEEKILELQKKKKLLSDKLLDSNNEANIFSKLTEKDIKELLSFDNKDE